MASIWGINKSLITVSLEITLFCPCLYHQMTTRIITWNINTNTFDRSASVYFQGITGSGLETEVINSWYLCCWRSSCSSWTHGSTRMACRRHSQMHPMMSDQPECYRHLDSSGGHHCHPAFKPNCQLCKRILAFFQQWKVPPPPSPQHFNAWKFTGLFFHWHYINNSVNTFQGLPLPK